jgi:23S rRNA (adenine2503-C2)-methyltransferase
VNDSLDDARRIAKLTRGIPAKINLIPFNEHPDSGFSRPERKEVLDFQRELMRLGQHVLIRRTMGRDIYAACGQLRSAMENHPKVMPGARAAGQFSHPAEPAS